MSAPIHSFIEFVHQTFLQVTRVDCIGLWIENSGHLEKEAFVWSLGSSGDLLGSDIKQEGVLQEFSRETTEDQNIFLVSLYNTSSLSVGEQSLWHFDQVPSISVWGIEPFNSIDVFSSFVCNTTKYVYLFLTKTAWAVVVSTGVEISHFEPKVNIWIVHLTFHLGIVLLFPWSSNNNKFIAKPTSGMSMSWVLHLISLQEFGILVLLDIDFPHRV